MGPARLDGSPDNELSLPALPAPSRDEFATDGVVLFLGRPPLLLLGLPLERLSPDIARVVCALWLPSLLLPPPLLDIDATTTLRSTPYERSAGRAEENSLTSARVEFHEQRS